jgi:hypothetical protein
MMRGCAVCSATLTGRADAIYCSSACRQKAHRVRTAQPRLQSADTVELINRARAAQLQSRRICREAVQRRGELITAIQQLATARHLVEQT